LGGDGHADHLVPRPEARDHLLSVLGRSEEMAAGRKCAQMPLNADRKRWAWSGDLKRFIARSFRRVG